MNITQIQEVCKRSNESKFHMIGAKATLNCEWVDVCLGLFSIVGEDENTCFSTRPFLFADDITYEIGHSDKAQNKVKG